MILPPIDQKPDDAWPLGDPVIRLKNHLTARGVWSDERHKQAEAEVMDTVMAAQREAESHGTLHSGGRPSVRDMFEGVYEKMPPHLRRQRQQAEFSHARKTMIEAIRDAMDVMMGRDDNVVVFGEDVGFFGGVFAPPRVCRRNTARAAASIRRSANWASSAPLSAWLRMVSARVWRSSLPTICPQRTDQVVSEAARAALSLQWPVHLPACRKNADRRRDFRRTDP